jgi:hypothetical protein
VRKRRYARSLVAVPAGVLAAILGVTTVLAATTWTVRPGGPVSMKSGKFILTDTATRQAPTCQSSALSGTLKGGSGLPGTGIGSITAAGWTNCTSPLGFRFTLQARSLPWHLNLSSYNATTGVVTGSLGHLRIKLSFPSCTAVIDGTSGTASDGTVKLSYTNSTDRLRLLTTGGNLHFYNVRGCAGLVVTGDPATISATFSVSPKQAITSP